MWTVGAVKMMRHVKVVGPGWCAEMNKLGDFHSATGQQGCGTATIDSVCCCFQSSFQTESCIFELLLQGSHKGGVSRVVVSE